MQPTRSGGPDQRVVPRPRPKPSADRPSARYRRPGAAAVRDAGAARGHAPDAHPRAWRRRACGRLAGAGPARRAGHRGRRIAGCGGSSVARAGRWPPWVWPWPCSRERCGCCRSGTPAAPRIDPLMGLIAVSCAIYGIVAGVFLPGPRRGHWKGGVSQPRRGLPDTRATPARFSPPVQKVVDERLANVDPAAQSPCAAVRLPTAIRRRASPGPAGHRPDHDAVGGAAASPPEALDVATGGAESTDRRRRGHRQPSDAGTPRPVQCAGSAPTAEPISVAAMRLSAGGSSTAGRRAGRAGRRDSGAGPGAPVGDAPDGRGTRPWPTSGGQDDDGVGRPVRRHGPSRRSPPRMDRPAPAADDTR